LPFKCDLQRYNEGTALNTLGKIAKSPNFSPKNLGNDGAFRELLRLAREFAGDGKLDAQAVANATHGGAVHAELC
jgi:hypothetical protein